MQGALVWRLWVVGWLGCCQQPWPGQFIIVLAMQPALFSLLQPVQGAGPLSVSRQLSLVSLAGRCGVAGAPTACTPREC